VATGAAAAATGTVGLLSGRAGAGAVADPAGRWVAGWVWASRRIAASAIWSGRSTDG
jgi:hypothetical protein